MDAGRISMKKYWLIILGVLLLFGAACDKEKEIGNYNSYLQTPRYSEAQKRAEIGNLFYETEEKIGIHTSFGVFLYDVEEEKILTAFDLNVEKAFGEGVLSETRLSSDEKGIYLFGFTHEKTIDDYHYYYEIASGSLYKKSGKAEEKDLFPLPDQDRQAFTTTNWTAEDLAYYPVGSLDPIYPLKGVQ